MMEQPFRVFVVEDEPAIQSLLEQTLLEACEVEALSTAEECLARLESTRPDLMLLDVGLPGMDGTSLCRKLKEDLDTQDIPIAFISGIDTMDARLIAYEAGAQDFISKPFKPAEVLRKVELAKHALDEKRKLHEQAGYAQRTAFAAMTSMSELGVVMQFLSKSFACVDGQAVARAVLDALAQYELSGAVQTYLESGAHCYSAQGTDIPLETSVLNHVRGMGRIFEFKTRGVYNYPYITLLINNMPLNDPDRCGRIRDNLAMLVEGADARLQAIEVEQANLRKQEGALQALNRVNTAIEALRIGNQRDRVRSSTLIQDLLIELERTFVTLGLTDQQENELQHLVKGYAELLIDIQVRDNHTEAQLHDLALVLRSLTDR